MGTETRIGIATGLLIVVVTSVYFFCGSDRSAEDPLMVSAAKAGDNNKTTIDKDTTADASASRANQRPAAKPLVPKPRKQANVQRPHRNQRRSLSNRRPQNGRLADRAKQTPGAPHANRRLASANRPQRDSKAADSSTAKAKASQDKPKPTHLRSNPSSVLLDATRKNLEQSPVRQRPSQSPGQSADKNKAKEESAADKAEPTAKDSSEDKPIELPRRATPRRRATQHPAHPPAETPASPTPKANDRDDRTRRTPAKPSTPPAWPKRHTIVSGDTLSGISTRYYGTVKAVDLIVKANPTAKNPRNLKIGDVLIIPAPPAAKPAAERKTPRATAASEPGATRRTRTPAAKPAARGVRTYRVQSGDSFYSIARKTLGDSSRWKEIFNANKSLVKNDPKKLRPGMELRIPS